MKPGPTPGPDESVDVWRSKLSQARLRYETATDEYRRLLRHAPEGVPPNPGSELARARQAESEALAEYTRALRVLAGLAARGESSEEKMKPDLVVVIDDDRSVRNSVKALLRSAGYRVATFESAESFLISGSVTETGCLILDIRMPGMDGLELQNVFTRGGSPPPIIFITGHDDGSLRERAIEAGAIEMLRKPFPPNALLSSVQTALSRAALPPAETDQLEPEAAQDDLRSEILHLERCVADLELLNADLAHFNQGLERFAFLVSHDLQEPLRIMATYAELLARQYSAQLDEKGRFVIGNIVEGASRMRQLLGDMLVFTELHSGPQGPAEKVDLNLVLEIVKQDLKVSIDETSAAITSDRLPILNAHTRDVIPLFQNLISNAIKYRGDRPPRIHISAETVDGELRLRVSDHGIGIDPQYHGQIFEAFKRLHGRSVPGSGLGLAICQQVVTRYAGRIWVESQAGHGAAFVFTLPDAASDSQMDEEVGKPASATRRT